ncbi:MAG: hypothetical protein GXO57_02550 [Thermodesulfobacteria bacterium]|nr:hypothetical protein [Thermodesulfobacteriota bacterium]
MRYLILFLSIVGVCFCCVFAKAKEVKKGDIEIKITREKTDNNLKISVCCKNLTSKKEKFIILLEVNKKGKAGKSVISQKSEVVVESEKEACPIKTKVNLNKGDECTIVGKLCDLKGNILKVKTITIKKN